MIKARITSFYLFLTVLILIFIGCSSPIPNNTFQQKNPLYKIVDRPEGPEIFKNKHKKLFNKKLLKMEYI